MKKVLFYLIITGFSSCQQNIKFDKNKWNLESDRGYYKNRNGMLSDILKNSSLKGKTIKELEDYFGSIEYDTTISNQLISFEVYQKWNGIEPYYTKYLMIHFNKKRKVDSIYIEEYTR